jgi:hypothetical protein
LGFFVLKLYALYFGDSAGFVVSPDVAAEAAGAASGGCVGTEGLGVSTRCGVAAIEPAGRKSPTGITPWYEFTE